MRDKKVRSYYSTSSDLPIFSEKALMIISAVVTFLLQCISFMTTFQGAEVYFGEVFFLAPIMFAIAVQSVVYFVSNSLQRRVSFTKIIAVILGIMCSSYFFVYRHI